MELGQRIWLHGPNNGELTFQGSIELVEGDQHAEKRVVDPRGYSPSAGSGVNPGEAPGGSDGPKIRPPDLPGRELRPPRTPDLTTVNVPGAEDAAVPIGTEPDEGQGPKVPKPP